MCERWRGAWARAVWRGWDLGNGTIMLQTLFNLLISCSIPNGNLLPNLSSSPLFFSFSFSPTAEISRLELEFEESFPRKTGSIFKEGIGQESNGAANQEKQIFLLCQISPAASSTRDLRTRLIRAVNLTHHCHYTMASADSNFEEVFFSFFLQCIQFE